jgi:ribosomal protein L29
MKKKELNELKGKPAVELEKEVRELKTSLRKDMFDLEAGKLQNVRTLRDKKKKIARLMTILNSQNGK